MVERFSDTTSSSHEVGFYFLIKVKKKKRKKLQKEKDSRMIKIDFKEAGIDSLKGLKGLLQVKVDSNTHTHVYTEK